MPVPTVNPEEELWVVSFDGSARVKRGGGSFSAIVWKLPEWKLVKAASRYAENLTVNEAEYNGLLLCFELLEGLTKGRLIICGDSNRVIRQMRGEIDCKAQVLTLLRQKAPVRLREWPDHDLLHVKRAWNASADSLASAALQRESGAAIDQGAYSKDLVTLNRLGEILTSGSEDPTPGISAVTTRREAREGRPLVLDEGSGDVHFGDEIWNVTALIQSATTDTEREQPPGTVTSGQAARRACLETQLAD
ncbi:Ribonuclease HI [Phytophthora citrophthora]|uniref:Ribonuclease HI n=1 Tax=Phytophthora citrophthora TaxID=4793 RepID=A0AAD9GVH1_9STRA|nr:Ribonuclease HI [Phytophthora citrophthora]